MFNPFKKKESETKIDFVQELKVLKVQPGDVIILKTDLIFRSGEAASALANHVKEIIGAGVKVILLEQGMGIGVLRMLSNDENKQPEGRPEQ